MSGNATLTSGEYRATNAYFRRAGGGAVGLRSYA